MNAIAVQPERTDGAMTQVDAAKFCGVTDRTFRRWEEKKIIAGKRVGGVKLYPVKTLRELIGMEG
jgi:hypothetical protein